MRSSDMIIDVSSKGEVGQADLDHARGKVEHLADLPREPVLEVQVHLEMAPKPHKTRPALAEATIDVNGTAVRAHVAADTMNDAVELLADRLRRRLERHEERLHREPERHRTGTAGENEWRHGDLPTQRPTYFDRPPEEREVVRRKTFALDAESVDEAAFDLDRLGHDFFLFTDIDTGSDCVLSYGGDGELVLQSTANPPPDISASAVPVSVHDAPPATLSIDQAEERLDVSQERFVFFVSADTGRGNVLYRRYDGHYGLIVPRNDEG